MTTVTAAAPARGTAAKPSAGLAPVTTTTAAARTTLASSGAGAAVVVSLSVGARRQLASLVASSASDAAGPGGTTTRGAVKLLDKLV